MNPVRAQAIERPEDWRWSSYRGTVGKIAPPEWLAVEKLLCFFGGQQANYRKFVAEGVGKASVWDDLKEQIYLGNDAFLERMQNLVDRKVVHGMAKAQTNPVRPSVDEIVATVGRTYGIPARHVLDKGQVEAYWLAVFLMRRAKNLFLG